MLILAIGGGIFIALIILTAIWIFHPRKSYKPALILEKVGPEQSWHQSFAFIPQKVAKGYFKRVYAKIASEIEDAKANTTPERVFIEQFVYSIGFFLFFLLLYAWFEGILWLVMAIGLGLYFFFEPRRDLVNKAKKLREEIRKETPNFALTVRLLIQGQKTPVDALKIACQHGVGKGLKPFADILYSDLDYLNPDQALQKFAWSTKVPELIEFSTAMSQYMTIGGGAEGEKILEDMEKVFRELDKKMLEREKEIRPAKVKAMNGIIMLDGLLFMSSIMLLYLLHNLNNPNIGF
ncbi:hypothetical protein [Brevibacillus marinus]|uniref:hypothetical protein n=1 Tax=Brevibacillus marinus TaxID=2496837 RepID=UPI000F81B489|nr:hypothetical protein [Brevibacillus marinus]